MEEKIIATHIIYKGKILTLREDRVLLENGLDATREVIEHVDSVGILAVDDEGNLLLVNQFRLPAGKILLEVPAGCLENGEEPETAVIRELREETGYSAGRIRKLGGFYLAPGYSTEYMHVYLASELFHSPLVAEDTEGIELIRQPLCNINRLISSGGIHDCKSIAAIMMLLQDNQA